MRPSRWIRTVVLVVIALVASVLTAGFFLYEWHDPIILEAPSKQGKSAVLVLFPGGLCQPAMYMRMLQALQQLMKQNGVSLTCVAVKYPTILGADLPPFWDPELLVKHALPDKYKKSKGPLFVGGHSLGAIFSQNIALKTKATRYKYTGAILYSGFILPKYRSELPKLPVLSLSGTRDGLNRLTAMANQYEEFREFEGFRLVAPAVLIEGMNHMQLANDHESYYTKPRDLTAEIPTEKAIKESAKGTSTFLLNAMGLARGQTTAFINSIVTNEQNYFDPFLDAADEDKTGHTCGVLQTLLHGSVFGKLGVETFEPYLGQTQLPWFALSKASLENSDRGPVVTVQTYLAKAFSVFGRSSVPQSFQHEMCKTLSKPSAVTSSRTCSEANELLFQDALTTVPRHVARSYETSPNKLVFNGDIKSTPVTSPDFAWSWSAELEMTKIDGSGLSLRFPKRIDRKTGELNCVVLPQSRMIEYIMIDSQRIDMEEPDSAKTPSNTDSAAGYKVDGSTKEL